MDEVSVTRRTLLKAGAGATGVAALSHALPSVAQQKKPMPDVIVLLPGITGSVLQKDGRDVWAPTASSLLAALLSLGGSLNVLKLESDPLDRDDLGDGVKATRVVPDVHLIPGLWKIDGYTKVSQAIRNTFAVQAGKNYFEFPYDWRRDNRVSARQLAARSHGWLKAWRQESGSANARLILVAHSMGGLVSRYFLECMDGWRDTRSLITFGTPYWGSLNALDFICNGLRKPSDAMALVDLTKLLRSFTSVYQLLPVYPCFDPGDGKLVTVGEARDIPNVDPQAAARALAFHREIDSSANKNADSDDYRRGGYKLHVVSGIFQPTLQSARLASGRVVLSTDYPGKDFDGDGTVPRPSAKPRNFTKDPTFVVERHGSLQNSAVSIGQLAGVLTGSEFEPTWGRGALSLQLLLEDSYFIGEPIAIRARHEPPEVAVTVRAQIQDAATGTMVARMALRPKSGGAHEGIAKGLPAGTYRLTVRTGSESVTDLFLVAGKA